MCSTASELSNWIDDFGCTFPVLGDFDRAVFDQYRDGPFRPQYVVFDREMTILVRDDTPDAHVIAEAAALAAL